MNYRVFRLRETFLSEQLPELQKLLDEGWNIERVDVFRWASVMVYILSK